MGHHGMEKMKKSNWMWQESEYRGSKKKVEVPGNEAANQKSRRTEKDLR
jgi:hypothetical protein